MLQYLQLILDALEKSSISTHTSTIEMATTDSQTLKDATPENRTTVERPQLSTKFVPIDVAT